MVKYLLQINLKGIDELNLLNTLIIIILAYLLGSMPFGIWVGKIFHNIDIREHGSKSSGGTNAIRVLGLKWGLLVMLLDAVKGSVACLLPALFHSNIHPIFIGAIAIIGHSYPIFANFKGGKSVATSAGVAFAMHPVYLCLLLVFFGVVLFLTSMVSVASVSAIFVAAITSLWLGDPIFSVFVWLVFIFVAYRHRANFQRIREGTENSLNFGLHLLEKNK